MQVVKRDGRLEEIALEKITNRIKSLRSGVTSQGVRFGVELTHVEPIKIAQKVINELHDKIKTSELDEFAAKTAAQLQVEHPEYNILAGRIIISNLHKNTIRSFSDTMKLLYQHRDSENNPSPLISHQTYKTIINNGNFLNEQIDYMRDYRIDYFGFKTLEKSYLISYQSGNLTVCERPQHLLMRVAVGIHGDDLEAAAETYNYLSRGMLMHATPTLFNAGTPSPQLSSCFLAAIGDSIEEIFECLKQLALISKRAGGIGLHLSNIRSQGSLIRGTNGVSNGLVPMLQVFNATARYVDQGGGKRKGSFAMYLEPWHAEIFEFLDLKKTTGHHSRRAIDLFYAMFVPDIFMKRLGQAIDNIEASQKIEEETGIKTEPTPVFWSLMCPDQCPGLNDCYGTEFENLYHKYESEGRYRKQLNIMTVWKAILDSQKETGTPYMVYKDHVNNKSNQKNLGVIKSSNLCAEIVEYSDQNETAVCNLCSIPLCAYVKRGESGQVSSYDHEGLAKAVQIATRNLNKVIDVNYYPTEPTRRSNMKHRPMGIGVQGLADTFCMMRYPFDSPEAARLNREIFQTIYYWAVKTSVELAKKEGAYSSFQGSPASQGLLQPDLWGWKPNPEEPHPMAYDWVALKAEVKEHGLRNSLLVALMPTASTAQILGNNEAFEPFTYNLYVRRVLSGEFTICNKHLQRDLMERALWNQEIIRELIKNQGSVQRIEQIPDDLKALYKTAYELGSKVQIDMAADRAPFVDQSQSMNIFMSNPDNNKLTSMHLYTWKKGLKTGMYYLRREAIQDAQQFTVTPAQPIVRGPVPDTPSRPKSDGGSGNASDNDKDNNDGPGTPKLCRIDDPDCLACQG